MPVARIQALMISMLARQLTLAQENFLTRYPSCWLLWEPGEWSVPGSGVDVNVAETQASRGGLEQRPLNGDALCFSLKVPPGTALNVGRAADNEIILSDMTVSRLHARLELEAGRWLLTPLSTTKKTVIAGKVASVGKPVALQSGEQVQLGSVNVTFYDPASFKARVASSTLMPKR